MGEYEGEASDAELSDMMSGGVALVTMYWGHGSDGVVDMLAESCDERGRIDLVEVFKMVQGLLSVVTVLGDWYEQASGVQRMEAIRQVARVNERRRPESE